MRFGSSAGDLTVARLCFLCGAHAAPRGWGFGTGGWKAGILRRQPPISDPGALANEAVIYPRQSGLTSIMAQPGNRPYVSRGGEKLAAALDAFGISPASWVCADLGSNVGGFVDCLLRRGALKVYAIDTGYGVLAYTLRTDPRVLVLERTNAMHVELPEAVDLVTIDVAWTRQHRILPAAMKLLKPDGRIVTLVKPHYEAPRQDLHRGLLAPAAARQAFDTVRAQIESTGLTVEKWIESPITGQKGNVEYLALLRPSF